MDNFLERIQNLSPKRLALLAYELQSKLEAMEAAKNEPIAVIGMGCRFPGDVTDPESYWQLLSSGQDPITEVPPERWDVDSYYHSDPSTPGKTYTRWGGFLQDVDQFDADFFGISPREAEQMDPQQRLLLEVSWEALERAGYGPKQLVGSRTGVYVAICTADYANLQSRARDLTGMDTYTGFGSGFSFAAGRLSYVLGLQGPNMSLDAACTSSLMGVHLGCQSLRDRECEMALVGGVNLVLSPETNVICSRTRMMAADGRCKTFDAAADGYVRSEACGVVVLKRLGDAIAAGDNVLAVIKGSSIGHSGASGGFTIPNGAVQQQTIRTALAQAGVQPHQVQYIETQGTGTPLGDAIEIRALGSVFKEERSPQTPLWLASVKTNIGNTETASGLAALMKVILSLQHQQLPPHLHLKQLNPDISLEDIPAKIPTQTMAWPQAQMQGQTRPIASINAYGMSGSTAHMVVEAAPEPAQGHKSPQRRIHLLPLSAKTPAALRQLIQRYNEYLKTHPDTNLGNLCFTASVGRAHFAHRLAFVSTTTAQLQPQLADYLASQSTPSVLQTRPKVIFSLSNELGEVDVPLAQIRELYDIHPTFQKDINHCAEILSLSPSIFLSHSSLFPSLIFACQYALAKLWQSWGMQPEHWLGKGIGHVVADCLSGHISLKAALQNAVSDQHADQVTNQVANQVTNQVTNQTINQHETAQTNQLIEKNENQYYLQISPQTTAWDTLMVDLSHLYRQGAEVDWVEFYRPYAHQRLVLPTYPFQRQRYWSRLAELGTEAIAKTLVPRAVKEYLSREALLAMDPVQQHQRLAMDLCDRIATALGANPAEITPDVVLDTLPLDSLMALEMKFDLEKTLGSTLPITSLLENRDIASLATEMLEGVTAEPTALLPQLTPAPDDRYQPFPLNDIQEAYWIGRSGLFEMGNVAAHVYSEFERVEGLDCDRLNQALQQLIERHDMLRAVILPDGQQQILETVPAYDMEVLDLRQASADRVEQRLNDLRDRLSHQIHDAHQWPLFTVCAAQLDSERVRVYLSFDNLLVDGTSMGLLCWEWGQIYQGLTDSLVPLTASFRDYVVALQAFEQSEVYQRSLDYWQARLSELPPAPDLPLAIAPANIQQPRFNRLTAQIEPETWQHLQKQATQVGLTPSSLLVAVYAEVLATWSKTRRFNLNLTTFNRLPIHSQVQNIVGDFTSLTLLAVDYTDSDSFWKRAKQLQTQLWQDLEHSYVSGVRVLRELMRSSASRVTVPVVFTSLLANPQLSDVQLSDVQLSDVQLSDVQLSDVQLSDVQLSDVQLSDGQNRSTFGTGWLGEMVDGIAQTPQVWLDHQVYEEAGTLVLNWDYVTDLFPAGMIESMLEAYVQGLRNLAQQPDLGQQQRFLQLPDWQQALQTQFNDTVVAFPDEYLHTLFLTQAQSQPQHPAIVTETVTLTYAELEQRSHRLSQVLQSLGVHTNQLIPVAMEKGWEQVVAVLGVLMAGAAYVPIDPALPQERRWQLIDQSLSPDDVPIVLTQSWLQTKLSWPEPVKSLAVDIECSPADVTEQFSSSDIHPPQSPYVLRTGFAKAKGGSSSPPPLQGGVRGGEGNASSDIHPPQSPYVLRTGFAKAKGGSSSPPPLQGGVRGGKGSSSSDIHPPQSPLVKGGSSSSPPLQGGARGGKGNTSSDIHPPQSPLIKGGSSSPPPLHSQSVPGGRRGVRGGSSTADIFPRGLTEVIDTQALSPAVEALNRSTQQTTDLAYVIYTSGSTGTPKGVVIDHRSAVNTILDINRRWQVGPSDRVFALSSLSFDLSVYDIFGTLAAGGTIVMPPTQAAKDPVLWSEMLMREQVTVWNSVPALMQMLVIHAAGRPDIVPPSLRLVLLSGDWLPLTLPDQIRRLAPAAAVVSLGGATEASIWSIFYPIGQVEADWPSIPYGHPLANQQFYVLDTQLENCPIWVAGHLYIGGEGLANGYWRDQAKTAKSFITHPHTGESLYRTGDLGRYLPNGEIEFLGREDNQVKLGGYRIELGEIEQALEQHPKVVQAVALIVGEADSGQQLVAYVCPDDKDKDLTDPPDSLSAQDLKAYLDQKLPSYMVPQGYTTLEAIPLTSNGKVDRRHLESLWQADSPSESVYIAPENAIQSVVVDIWQEILKREPIGIQDNFFELGGDSLLAIQVMTRVRESFHVEVSLRHLFEDPSVAQLADAIAQALAEQIDPDLLAALEPDRELDVEASGAFPTTGGETIDG